VVKFVLKKKTLSPQVESLMLEELVGVCMKNINFEADKLL
jgi:hypothetical protein